MKEHYYSNGGFFFLENEKFSGRGIVILMEPVFFLHLRCTVSLSAPSPLTFALGNIIISHPTDAQPCFSPPPPSLSLCAFFPLPPSIHPLDIFHFLTSSATSLRRGATFKVLCFFLGSKVASVSILCSQGRVVYVSPSCNLRASFVGNSSAACRHSVATTLLVHRCSGIHRQHHHASFVGIMV